MKVFDPYFGKARYQKRRRRYDELGHARELTFSCFRGYRFLERDRVRTWFLEALDHARRTLTFDLWAYVLMPEHVHLLIYPRTPDGCVSGILRAIKEPVGRKAIDHLKQAASPWLARLTVQEGQRLRHRFWQPGGGYDRNIVEPATAHLVAEYIHANPVRRGFVERPEDWQWSSARWYAGMRPVPVEMDRTMPIEAGGAC